MDATLTAFKYKSAVMETRKFIPSPGVMGETWLES